MKKMINSLPLVLACFNGLSSPVFGAEAVELKRAGTHIDVLVGGKPFSTYYFDPDVAKAYFQPLRSAQGTIVTRGFPVVNDVPLSEAHDPSFEPHQRPMYFAHGDVNGYDFWSEQVFQKYFPNESASRYGRMVFLKLDEIRGGADAGVLRAKFGLAGPDGKVFAEEVQSFIFRGSPTTRVIDCEFSIHASQGPVKLGDTKEGTFAIRVVKELDSPPAHMVNSHGGVGEREIWGKRADWVDYYGNVDGEDVGIAVLDSPKSFRHPTYWHARGYGLFAANPFGIKAFTGDPHADGSYTIPAGRSLSFRYRILIHHGDYKAAKIAEAYEQYATEEKYKRETAALERCGVKVAQGEGASAGRGHTPASPKRGLR